MLRLGGLDEGALNGGGVCGAREAQGGVGAAWGLDIFFLFSAEEGRGRGRTGRATVAPDVEIGSFLPPLCLRSSVGHADHSAASVFILCASPSEGERRAKEGRGERRKEFAIVFRQRASRIPRKKNEEHPQNIPKRHCKKR